MAPMIVMISSLPIWPVWTMWPTAVMITTKVDQKVFDFKKCFAAITAGDCGVGGAGGVVDIVAIVTSIDVKSCVVCVNCGGSASFTLREIHLCATHDNGIITYSTVAIVHSSRRITPREIH